MKPKIKIVRHLLASVVVLSANEASQAGTFYWNTTTAGTWATGGNWSDDPVSAGVTGVVPGSGDSAAFNQSSVNGATTIQLDADASISAITVTNTGPTTIKSSDTTSRALTIGSGGIAVNSGAGVTTIGGATELAPVTLGAAQSWTNNAATTLTIQNAVTNDVNLLTVGGTGNTTVNGIIGAGTGGLTKTGAGTLTLGAVNTYSGDTAIQGGKLNLAKIATSSMAKAGTGTITLSGGGTLQTNGGNSDYMGLSNNLSVAAGQTGNLLLANRISVTGTLTGAADTILNVTTNYIRDDISGDWSGFYGQLNVGGTGQFRLASTFGLPNAKVDIGAGATVLHTPASNATQNIGELSGAATSTLTIEAAPRAVTWSIGGLNTSSTFSGAITNGNGTSTLTKVGSGTLTLGGTSTLTGAVNVDNGTLALNSTGVITQSGSLTIQGSGSYTFFVNGGSATFTGAATLANNSGTSPFVSVNAGTFKAASLSMSRTGGKLESEPTQGFNNAGLYVQGASDVDITGNLSIIGSNSNASARFDGGTVDVGGVVTIGLASSARWSVLDVNGATFTSTDATTGIQIGSASEGNAIFLVRAGTATVEKITFNKPGTAVLQGVARINGGTLYVGAGGVATTGSNTNFSTTLKLAGGVLGAKAPWMSAADVNVQLTGLPTIQAADSLATGQDIEVAGAISGAGGFVKTGGGKLTLSGTNTYTGTTTVSAGTLELAGTTGSSLRFVPTSTGVSNKITGAGTLTLKGAFDIDLTGAVATVGNSWTLVDVGTLAETFEASFSVAGFTENSNVWTKPDGANLWQFEESTGVLSYVVAPVGGFSSWITGTFANGNTVPGGRQGANDDPDGDGVTNLEEYAVAGLDPTVPNGAIGTFIGKTLAISKRQPLAADITYAIEESTDLGASDLWQQVPAGPTYVNDTNTISYTLPGGPAKDFLRFKVEKP